MRSAATSFRSLANDWVVAKESKVQKEKDVYTELPSREDRGEVLP